MSENWEQRFHALEREVAALREELRLVRIASHVPPTSHAPPRASDAADAAVGPHHATPAPHPVHGPPPAIPLAPVGEASAPAPSRLAGPEVWVTRLGAVLVILGVTFFFKYAIDQGWISELVRVVIGAAVGAVLLAAGVRTAHARPVFSQAAAGAGLAVLAASAWAATALYHLLPSLVGASLLAGVAVVAVLLSLRWASPPLAVLGVFGAFVTPFIVPSPDPSPLGYAAWFWVTTAIVAAVYLVRGWRSVFWTGAVATLPSLLVFSGALATPLDAHLAAAAVFSLAVALGYAVAPALRVVMREEGSDAGGAAFLAPGAWLTSAALLYDALPSSPVSAIAVAGVCAAAASLLARAVDARGQSAAAGAQAVGVIALGVWAAGHATPNHAAFSAVVAAELVAAFVFTWATKRGAPLLFAFTAVAAAIGLLAVDQLYEPSPTRLALACAACITIVAAAWGNIAVQPATRRPLALLFAHVLTMGAALHLGDAMTGGVAAASVVWAVLAAVEVVVGLRGNRRTVIQLAGLTFASLAAKLLFVDLVAVPLALRVALFGGLGAALLAFGWFLPRLAPKAADSAPAPPPPSHVPPAGS